MANQTQLQTTYLKTIDIIVTRCQLIYSLTQW